MADSNTNEIVGRHNSSPLLLTSKAMELVLAKERMRCDRYGHFFSLIVIQLNHGKGKHSANQLRLLGEILHKRLRLTDEKGLLLKGGVGVLLPMTELQGARVAISSIMHAATRHGLSFDAEVFAYSGAETRSNSSGNKNVSLDSDSEISFDMESNEEDTVIESTSSSIQNTVSTVALPLALNRIVRADDMSQARTGTSRQLLSISAVHTKHICMRYPAWKRCMDFCCSLIGLAFAIPVIVLAAIAIKLTSKGPIFFRQMRTGQFGIAFPIYKLRTMVVDAEELKEKLLQLNERDGPAFKIKNDPRVTKLGKLLRKTGIDELPQLWNVLVGHMAIVGPRPLPCNEDAKCKVWHRRRLDTKPGLTCIWQISKSRKISFSDWMRMDLSYADKRTAVGDIRLMFNTVIAVFLGRVGH